MEKEMSNKEFERLNKEIEEWNKLKKDIKEQANIVTLKNYDKDSVIFKMLGISKKKEKDELIRVISGASENAFTSTFNAMIDYFEKTLKKDYVKIEDISVFKNIFGIIKDKIKSWKEEVKGIEEDIVRTKKKIVKSKNYDEQQNLKFDLYRYDDRIKESHMRISILEHSFRQLKFDIKSLETQNTGSGKQ